MAFNYEQNQYRSVSHKQKTITNTIHIATGFQRLVYKECGKDICITPNIKQKCTCTASAETVQICSA